MRLTLHPALRAPALMLGGLCLLILVAVFGVGVVVIHALRPKMQADVPTPRFEIPTEIPHCAAPEMETVYVHVTPGAIPDPVVAWRFECGGREYVMLPEVNPHTPEVSR